MKIEEDFHMMGGCGETSYANNSKLQEKAIFETKPLMERAIREIFDILLLEKLAVADLGCSSGPNAILILSGIINAVDEHCFRSKQQKPEIQFFLNDLPTNDFNHIFQQLVLYEKQVRHEKGDEFVSFYIAGLPGSFYRRLFPSKSVHLFNSNYSLMWLSQVPSGLEGEECTQLNKGNIYINEDSFSLVSHLYLEQFKKDFSAFLKSRSKELIFGGRMILSILGRTNLPSIGECSHFCGLLSEALKELVSEGLLKEEKFHAFNLPFYTPSMEEVKSIIEQEGSFHLIQEKTFESNWDPFDESTNNFVRDRELSAENIVRHVRAAIGPLLTSHFGDEIFKDLLPRYTKNISRYLSKGKPKFTVLALFLKLRDEIIEFEEKTKL